MPHKAAMGARRRLIVKRVAAQKISATMRRKYAEKKSEDVSEDPEGSSDADPMLDELPDWLVG